MKCVFRGGLFVFLLPLQLMAADNFRLVRHREALCLAEVKASPTAVAPVIAVMDGGVTPDIPTLNENLWLNGEETAGNGLDDDGNGYVDDVYGWNFDTGTNDVFINGAGNWHGTPVNTIVASLCPQARLLNIVKATSVASIMESLDYVYRLRKRYNESGGRAGAFIVAVNCSWGKEGLRPDDNPEWCAMYDRLGSVGVLCVSSVPNEDRDIDVQGDMPASCSSEYLITVTNTDGTDRKVSGAAYGAKSVDLAAPGDSTYTLLNTGMHGYFGGTSAAAPYVTAAIGLLYTLADGMNATRQAAQVALAVKEAVLTGCEEVDGLRGLTVTDGRLDMGRSMERFARRIVQNAEDDGQYKDKRLTVSVSPNPVHEVVCVEVQSATYRPAQLSVFNSNGLLLRQRPVLLLPGFNAFPMDMSALPTGFYMMALQTAEYRECVKVLVE